MNYKINLCEEIENLESKITKITNLLLEGCQDPILREDLNHYREKLKEMIQLELDSNK